MMTPLTEEELRLLPSFYERRWLPVARLTGPPSDRDAAYDAVKELCRRAKRPVPKSVRWITGAPTNDKWKGKLSFCVANFLCVRCMMRALIDKADSKVANLEAQQKMFWHFDRSGHTSLSWTTLHGGRNHHEVCFTGSNGRHLFRFDFYDQMKRRGFEFVRPWRELSIQAGAFWWGEEGVVFSEHPVKVVRNEQGQVGNADGPAIVYGNGDEIYAWKDQLLHKTRMVKEIEMYWEGGLVVSIIRGDIAGREASVLIDMYGPARFVDEAPKKYKRKLDESKWGTLWEIGSRDLGRERRLFVEVFNSSGAHERHVIPVHPFLHPLGRDGIFLLSRPLTALQAIASTFGMDAREYEKIVQS